MPRSAPPVAPRPSSVLALCLAAASSSLPPPPSSRNYAGGRLLRRPIPDGAEAEAGGDADVEVDVDDGDGGGDEPTSPDETPTRPCVGLGWHVDPVRRDGCTDDDGYDPEWTRPGIVQELWFYPTAEECCARFFGGGGEQCVVRESGCVPLLEGSGDDANTGDALFGGCDAAAAAGWHPDFASETKSGCANDGRCPEGWTELYDTARGCCEVYADANGACPVRDACDPSGGVTTYLSGPTRPPTTPPSFAPTTLNEWRTTYYRPPSRSREGDDDVDFFLLSGQSNMHGHSTSSQSIGGNGDYWLQIKSILESSGDDGREATEGRLRDAIRAANAREGGGDLLASTLANETLRLLDAGLLDELDAPLRWGSCSFLDPLDRHRMTDRSNGTQPTVWNANCGGIFGPELMFGRTLEIEMGARKSFEMAKVAHGGTRMHQHWYPDHGKFWENLRSAIRSRKGYGSWKAFVWHQGINGTYEGGCGRLGGERRSDI